jgi:hypothetical protein
MRLRDILKAKIKCDAKADLPLLDAIDRYVMNPRTPEAGKLQALAKMDDVMGISHPADPQYALKVYVNTRAEDYV